MLGCSFLLAARRSAIAWQARPAAALRCVGGAVHFQTFARVAASGGPTFRTRASEVPHRPSEGQHKLLAAKLRVSLTGGLGGTRNYGDFSFVHVVNKLQDTATTMAMTALLKKGFELATSGRKLVQQLWTSKQQQSQRQAPGAALAATPGLSAALGSMPGSFLSWLSSSCCMLCRRRRRRASEGRAELPRAVSAILKR